MREISCAIADVRQLDEDVSIVGDTDDGHRRRHHQRDDVKQRTGAMHESSHRDFVTLADHLSTAKSDARTAHRTRSSESPTEATTDPNVGDHLQVGLLAHDRNVDTDLRR